jgi:phosphoglycolate phosphatase
MPAYRLAIFDFDGTLADSADWFFGVMNAVARRYGFREIDEAEREELRGRSNREVIQALGVPMWKLPLIARDMRRRVAAEADSIPLFPWVPGLLERLAGAGVTIAIASSNTEPTMARILGPAAADVAAFSGGASLFGKASKFRALTKRFGVDPSEVAAIGDEGRDLEAAREAGVAGIAVTWGFAKASALSAAGPAAMVDDPVALERLLLGQNPVG